MEEGINLQVLNVIFNKEKLYYHEMMEGIVYLNSDYSVPLINIEKITGKKTLPHELSVFKITSGIKESNYGKFLKYCSSDLDLNESIALKLSKHSSDDVCASYWNYKQEFNYNQEAQKYDLGLCQNCFGILNIRTCSAYEKRR